MAKSSRDSPVLLPGLPDELGLLCLAKLPIDAVARCRAVSRLWASALLQYPRASRFPQPMACFCTGSGYPHRESTLSWILFSRSDRRCYVVPFFNMKASRKGLHIYSSQMQVITTGTSLLLVRSRLKFSGYVLTSDLDHGDDGIQEPGELQGFDLWQMKWCREIRDGRHVPPMHVNRWGFATAHIGEHVYVAGGEGDAMRSAERLNLKTGRWEVLPEMIKERSACPGHPGGFAMRGRFYVVGGEFQPTTNTERLTQSGEFYDPEKRTWTLVPGMWPEEMWGYGVRPNVVVVKEEAYAIGTRGEVMRWREKGGWEMAGKLPQAPEFNIVDERWFFDLVGVGEDELWVIFLNKDEEYNWLLFACNPSLAMDGGLNWEHLPFTVPPSMSPEIVASVGVCV